MSPLGLPARIVEHEPEAEASEGQLAVLKCAAEGDPEPQVVWTHDNTQVGRSRPAERRCQIASLRLK